jgi:uracil-DNA glycosylase
MVRCSSSSATPEGFVEALARAQIGATHNQYEDSPLRRARLIGYLASHGNAEVLLVGEAAGYRGARVSGIPFTSERQLTGAGPAEASATIVHYTLPEFGLAHDVLLWNVVPTHPGTPTSNRRPTRKEVTDARPFLEELAWGRRIVAVGRLAAAVTGAPYVRHPAHGGAAEFRAGLLSFAAGAGLLRRLCDDCQDVQRQAGRGRTRLVSRRR